MASHADARLAHLTELFADLPGLGPKSASRLVDDLLGKRRAVGKDLAKTLAETLERVRRCPGCNTLTTEALCPLCAGQGRDQSVICVVESPADLAAIESSVSYRGRYFVLTGRVNPLEGVGPREVGADRLIEKAQQPGVHEVVIATSYTPEGEATAHLLAAALKKQVPGIKVTRLARGLPAGVEVEYTDAASIATAVVERREIEGREPRRR